MSESTPSIMPFYGCIVGHSMYSEGYGPGISVIETTMFFIPQGMLWIS